MKRFLLAWLAVFVAYMLGDFAVHGVWLASQYEGLAAIYRPAATQAQYMPYMLVAHLMIAWAFTWIYGGGATAAGWMGQGIRFGLALAVVMAPQYLIYYSIQPLPLMLVCQQMIGTVVVMVVVGVVAAFMHRGARTA